MKVSANTLKWALRFYPPLFFQRIWVVNFGVDYKSVEVKIKKSFLNTNYNKSIFGGTIFSATDPFYALLFDQFLRTRDLRTRVWLKSASIQYLKPARTDLRFNIVLTDDDVAEAEVALIEVGKFIKTYKIEIFDLEGKLCATASNEVYIRNLFYGEHQTIAY